jgi:hypothetical protein
MPKQGRVKVKKVMPNGSEEDANVLNDMFEQMTGSQGADTEIIIPKLTRLHNLLTKFIKIYQLLLNFGDFIDKFQEYNKEFDEIRDFIKNIQKIVDTEQSLSETKLKTMHNDQVNNLYKTLKNKQEVQSIIVTSGNLGKYKRYLEDKDNLKDEFIKREPGYSLTPLSFTHLDIKILWASDKLTNMAKKYILNILNHTYKIGHEMYEVITSPDIDIKKFSQVLIANIDKMKKTIPRCDKAFDIIKNSVELLEGNFKGYYRNSVEAENPSIIVESFIIDVSMSQKANASITGQFRRIIMYMKKQSANNNDPRVKQLFKILNSQFDLMAKKTGVDPVDDDDKNTDKANKEPSANKDKDTDKDTDTDNEEPTNADDEKNNMEEMLTGLMGQLSTKMKKSETDESKSDDDLPELADIKDLYDEPDATK